MVDLVPTTKLPTGYEIPVVGLGTWKSAPGDVRAAVEEAISCGYRHIDCAFIYQNENEIGEAIQAKIADGTVKREDLFITSKLWNEYHDPKLVKQALQESLKALQVSYLDLYLIHWPYAMKRVETGAQWRDFVEILDFDYLDTWFAMETLVDEGLVRTIGLSNFGSKQIMRIFDKCRIRPSLLQVEIHPYLCNSKVVDFCQQNNITVTAYSPFASPDPARYSFSESEPKPLQDDRIKAIAEKYGKTPAHVILRWLLQRNIVVIPKSVIPSEIHANKQVFDFSLSAEDMNAMYNLGISYRINNVLPDSKNYPFNDDL